MGVTGESINHHLYRTIAPTLRTAHPMAGTLEVTVNTNNASLCLTGLRTAGAE